MADVQKTKPIAELRTLDMQALTEKVAELKKQLVEQQRAHAANELPNPKAISATRKQIAQALTLLGAAVTPAADATKKEEK